MSNQKSFKSRVREAAIKHASKYYSYYVTKSYLLLSDAFQKSPYYVVEAESSNYLHLIGVSTSLSASDFFNKCLNGVLQESDFDLAFHGKDSKFSKGTIRQKILALPGIFNILSVESLIEEDFQKIIVRCSFASSDDLCTLGFIATPQARPMTLLRGNELNPANAKPLSLVLSKERDAPKYSDLLVGSDEVFTEYISTIQDFLTDELITNHLITPH